jgi:hypothetical protein
VPAQSRSGEPRRRLVAEEEAKLVGFRLDQRARAQRRLTASAEHALILRSYAFLIAAGAGTHSLVTAVMGKSLARQHAFRVLGLHLAVCAFLSGCAGERDAGPTSPQAATGETTPATNSAARAATTAGATTPVEAGEEPSDHDALWSRKKLVRTLAGSRIRVEGRVVRLDAGTLTCSGEGDGRMRSGRRLWTDFSCIQPTFPPGQLAGPDAIFRVQATGTAKFRVRAASFSRY